MCKQKRAEPKPQMDVNLALIRSFSIDSLTQLHMHEYIYLASFYITPRMTQNLTTGSLL